MPPGKWLFIAAITTTCINRRKIYSQNNNLIYPLNLNISFLESTSISQRQGTEPPVPIMLLCFWNRQSSQESHQQGAQGRIQMLQMQEDLSESAWAKISSWGRTCCRDWLEKNNMQRLRTSLWKRKILGAPQNQNSWKLFLSEVRFQNHVRGRFQKSRDHGP